MFGAKIVDAGYNTMVIEMTGTLEGRELDEAPPVREQADDAHRPDRDGARRTPTRPPPTPPRAAMATRRPRRRR
ncbi:MAG: hypothetical protein U0Z44_07185 [Kouleothrix sp.]